MDHRHQAQIEFTRSGLWRALAVPRFVPHVREARYRYLVQANHSRTAVVLYPAHHDHNHVHGRVRRHRQNQHRRTTATALLPRRHLPLDLLCRMPESNKQDVHRKREHVRQGVFSAPRRATCHHHKQPRSTQHPDGIVPHCLRLLPYLHRSADSPQHLPFAHATTHRTHRSTRARFRSPVQQPHNKVSRPHLLAQLYRSALDVRHPRNLPAQHHRRPAP